MSTKRALPKLSAIDLNLLVALDALLREANVTTAGKRIGLSQPAMSHALARLRELLQDPLLVRQGGVMRATALGERLAPRVQRLLSEIDATLLGHRAFDPATAIRTFRIATNDYCGALIMPAFLKHLRRRAPGVALELHAHQGGAPVAALERGELDLAVGTFLGSEPGIERELLFTETFACLGSRERSWKRLTVEQFAALDHVLVTSPGYGAGVVDHALTALGFRRRVVARTPHFLVAPALVEGTEAIVTLPSRLAQKVSRATSLRAFAPPLSLPSFEVTALWHAESQDAASRWLREQLLELTRSFPS